MKLTSNGDGRQNEFATSVYFPDLSLNGEFLEHDLEAWFSGVQLRPRRAKLKREELSRLNGILLALDTRAEAEGFTATLPAASDVFVAIDATLADEPGWKNLRYRAYRRGKIELFAVTAVIEQTQD